MPQLLAKLSDLKRMIGTSEPTQDVLLTQMLNRASANAEGACGRTGPGGGLRRRTGVVEFPESTERQCWHARLRLRLFPIERIVSVKELSSPGSTADFDAVDDMVEGLDYVGTYETGVLRRLSACFWLEPRCLRVQYDAGYLDPATVAAAWLTATPYTLGTFVRFTADNDSSYTGVYVCAASHTSGPSNQPDSDDGPTYWTRVNEVPEDLQQGVLQEAQRLWRQRDKAGATNINAGNGNSLGLANPEIHPDLKAACDRLRFVEL